MDVLEVPNNDIQTTEGSAPAEVSLEPSEILGGKRFFSTILRIFERCLENHSDFGFDFCGGAVRLWTTETNIILSLS